jgi:hypothetical protein
MYSACRHLVLLAIWVAMATVSLPARGWVETAVKADAVTLDVERSLAATVSHEILIQVRGGPLKSFELGGIDSDADLLPDSTVTRARSGGAGAAAMPLLLAKRDDGTLVLEVDQKKGLGRGVYLFKFRYRTDLRQRGLVAQRGNAVELSWIGPRLPDGVDGAQVTFRLPSAPVAPHVLDADRLGPGNAAPSGGVFLSNLRRAADKDELEVVRPHVARGEPVVWRVETDAQAFEAFAHPNVSGEIPLLEPKPGAPLERASWLGGGLLLAFLYGTLVMLKWRALVRAGTERNAETPALLPLPAALRAVLAGLGLAGAMAVVKLASKPTSGALLMLAAMAFATHVSPRVRAQLRGPGHWLALPDEEAFQPRRLELPGRWLDAGTLPGFVVFTLALAISCLMTVSMLGRSVYDAALIALGSAAYFPIFLTGRTSDLALDPVTGPARLLNRLARRLRLQGGHKVVAWARIPDGCSEPDELRLLLVPRPPAQGLRAIEVGMEYGPGDPCRGATPCVLVRAIEGSLAQRRLGSSLPWIRGRTDAERVALLRPKLPTFALTLTLLERVLALLTDERIGVRRPRHLEIRTPTPGGRVASASKPGTTLSPVQPT